MPISDLRKRYNRLDEIALSRIDPAYWYGVQVRSSGNYRRPIARHHPSAHALSTLPHLHVKLAASRRRTHPLIARVRGANMLRLAIAMEQRRVTGIVAGLPLGVASWLLIFAGVRHLIVVRKLRPRAVSLN